MVTVYMPPGFEAEKNYILEILLNEYLGLSYQIKESREHYKLEVNDKVLIIEDHFFGIFNEKNGYLSSTNIPDKVNTYSSAEFEAQDMPVIYGVSGIEKTAKGIRCQIDLFASSFFMLTRWEEYVCTKRDAHNRFPSQYSLAYKHNFLERPVVNEYVVVLKKILSELSPSLEFKKWDFQCIPTHDVDHLQKWGDLAAIRKKIAHDFITERRFFVGLKNIYDLLISKMGFKKDPYNTFEYIVNLSKSNGLISRFYIMSGGNSRYDNNYQIRQAKSIIDFLKDNNQIVGFHPSYESFGNTTLWQEERHLLNKISGIEVKEGRQHYLRFRAPETWSLWNDQQMTTDSTLGYPENPGFRAGTCYPYSVFNFITKKKLGLKENPLILMETTLISYMKLSPADAFERARKLYFTVKKYKGNFTFLWHNSAMQTIEDLPYLHIYENIIKGFPEDAA